MKRHRGAFILRAGVLTVVFAGVLIGVAGPAHADNLVGLDVGPTPIELRARPDGERVWLGVVDRGPGITTDDQGRIFDKFGRGRTIADRKVPGVGLGLYLSQRIVRAHGSELTVASTLGEGTVFGFVLERAE